jgi:hypothetical protein
MAGVIRLEVMTPRRSGAADSLRSLSQATTSPRAFINALITLLAGAFAGFGARVRCQIDESTPKAATGSVAFTQASLTAGDQVIIRSGSLTAILTAVASGPVAASGQFSIETSNTAVGDSFVLALAAFPAAAAICTGVNTTGTVALTAREAGTVGNAIFMSEKDASGGIALTQFSGGLDPSPLTTVLGTFSGTGTANDTITIGGVVLTLVASAANENQITIGGSAAASATNTIAVINANSKLKGFVLASSGGSAVVSLQLLSGGRFGNMVGLFDNGTGFSWAAASFAPATTEAWVASPVVYSVGAPS